MSPLNRRDFLASSAAAGASMMLSRSVLAQAEASGEELNVAFIGVGRQGKILLNHLLTQVDGVRIKAVCDIWEYSRQIGSRLCKRYKQDVKVYEDFREMLADDLDLDAAIIAIPDFVHHEVTNACLEAGLHVYCEKEMSNDIEKARSMVKAAQKTGKLLQIGHQRRSNPFYVHAYDFMHKDKFFGNITSVNGQWHQQKPLLPVPSKIMSKYPIPEATLNKFGYESMAHFYEWRWFKKYAGGPMTDLGSHQVDIFIWYLDKPPISVYALGGLDFATSNARENEAGYTPECLDHTYAMYEWDTDMGKVHGHYRVNLTSSHGGFYEEFMGAKGSMRISEIREKNAIFRESTASATEWEDEAEKIDVDGQKAMTFDPLKSRKAKGKMDAEAMEMEESMNKPVHVPHLENFFAAIRDKNIKLTCPAEVGFETAVACIKANESAISGKPIHFQPGDFVA